MEDGKILIGGANLILPSETQNRTLLRLNTDGSYDASFNGGNPGFDVNSNPVVEGLLKSVNNRLIVWGNFFSYNAQSRRSLVALNLDGTLVTPNPYAALPTNFIVPDNIIEQPNGRLLVTGDFTYSGSGIPGTYPGLFRLLPTGAFDANFRIGSGFGLSNGASYDPLFTKLVDHSILLGNKLLVCGGFTVFNGVARNRVARINLGDVITPVTWLSFTATAASAGALLQWRTANEQQNRGFEVQRSSDGQNYTTIGFVVAVGNGNNTQPSSYNFSDATAIKGIAYYRLKQLDNDGGFEYSSVRQVRNGNSSDFKIIPTVATTSIQLQLPNGGAGVHAVTVYSVSGKQIMSLAKAQNNQRLYIGNLPAGSYYVQIQTSAGTQTARFIKQ
jgi:hypothetical protein